jgi:DNA-binding NarL/FixJ family response regulator
MGQETDRGEISVVIADDHPIFREGLRRAVESEASLRVAAEARKDEEALALIRAHSPRVAVLDIQMPRLDGFGVARAVRAEGLAVGIAFLTVYRDEDLFNAALDLGVRGYVLKDSAATDIVSCIRAVASGQHYASPALTSHLVNRGRRAAALAGERPGLATLTPTERRVLRLIADYKTSREIADELFVSPRTVETHRSNICQKLGLHGSHALMKFALSHKSELS